VTDRLQVEVADGLKDRLALFLAVTSFQYQVIR